MAHLPSSLAKGKAFGYAESSSEPSIPVTPRGLDLPYILRGCKQTVSGFVEEGPRRLYSVKIESEFGKTPLTCEQSDEVLRSFQSNVFGDQA